MNTKESFVHFHSANKSSWALGFTARIVPQTVGEHLGDGKSIYRTNDKGDVLCLLAITFCNPKDKHWCKAIGREEVKLKELKEVRARDLPRLLAEARYKAIYGDSGTPYNNTSAYDYVLRRFV